MNLAGWLIPLFWSSGALAQAFEDPVDDFMFTLELRLEDTANLLKFLFKEPGQSIVNGDQVDQ